MAWASAQKSSFEFLSWASAFATKRVRLNKVHRGLQPTIFHYSNSYTRVSAAGSKRFVICARPSDDLATLKIVTMSKSGLQSTHISKEPIRLTTMRPINSSYTHARTHARTHAHTNACTHTRMHAYIASATQARYSPSHSCCFFQYPFLVLGLVWHTSIRCALFWQSPKTLLPRRRE